MNLLQVVLPQESVVPNLGDAVLCEKHVFHVGQDAHLADLRDAILPGVKVLQGVVVVQVVVISQVVDLVRLDVQPLDTGGYKCVVEPGQSVVGDVEPLECDLRLEKSIDILQLIFCQIQRLQVLQGFEGLLFKFLEAISTEIQVFQIWGFFKGPFSNSTQLIATNFEG